MEEIIVDQKGVAHLLDGLNVHKAPSPDGLDARTLKESGSQISPFQALIFSLLPTECHLLITFADSLDPDKARCFQARQKVGPDLGPSCLTLTVFLKEF